MKMEMLAVRDAKVEAFMVPFFAQSVGSAERSFGDLARDKEHAVGQHPEDYALFYLGSFNQETGQFDLLPQPVQVALAMNLLGDGGPRLS